MKIMHNNSTFLLNVERPKIEEMLENSKNEINKELKDNIEKIMAA